MVTILHSIFSYLEILRNMPIRLHHRLDSLLFIFPSCSCILGYSFLDLSLGDNYQFHSLIEERDQGFAILFLPNKPDILSIIEQKYCLSSQEAWNYHNYLTFCSISLECTLFTFLAYVSFNFALLC